MTERSDPVPLAAVLDAVNATTAELSATKAEVQWLRKYGRRNRKFIIFDIALTLALTLIGTISVHAVQSADNARAGQVALCQAGNVSRAQQVQLWDYILAISGQPKTAEQRTRANAFRAYLARDFAPRNCAALANEKK